MDRIVREMDMPVDNGFQEIYINASADDGADIADLMKIFTVDNEYDDERFPATSKIKRRFKETDEGVNKMCEIISITGLTMEKITSIGKQAAVL